MFAGKTQAVFAILTLIACSFGLSGCSSSDTGPNTSAVETGAATTVTTGSDQLDVSFRTMFFSYQGKALELAQYVDSNKAADGCTFLLVNYSITNNANTAERPALWAAMRIKTASGKVYSPDKDSFALAVLMDNMRSEMQPAMEKQCFTPFLLPLSVLQSEEMTLILPCSTRMMEVPLRYQDGRIVAGKPYEQAKEGSSVQSEQGTTVVTTTAESSDSEATSVSTDDTSQAAETDTNTDTNSDTATEAE